MMFVTAFRAAVDRHQVNDRFAHARSMPGHVVARYAEREREEQQRGAQDAETMHVHATSLSPPTSDCQVLF